jgi:hypothetical protein
MPRPVPGAPEWTRGLVYPAYFRVKGLGFFAFNLQAGPGTLSVPIGVDVSQSHHVTISSLDSLILVFNPLDSLQSRSFPVH